MAGVESGEGFAGDGHGGLQGGVLRPFNWQRSWTISLLGKMARVDVGNLDSRVTERDLENELCSFGIIRSVWVARRPLEYAFIDFDDHRDAQDAIHELDGKNSWRVELSHNSSGGHGGGRGGRSGDSDLKCYECEWKSKREGEVEPGSWSFLHRNEG